MQISSERMNFSFTSSKAQVASLTGLIIVTFLDIFLPKDITVDSLFLLCFLFVLKEPKRVIYAYTLLTFLAVSTVFVVEFSHYDTTFEYVNKGISLLDILITAFLVIMYRTLLENKAAARERQVKSIEEMLFMTSHKVRQPVAHILGVSNMLNESVSPEELKKIVAYMKESAVMLDTFTGELTEYMHTIRQKESS
jgi:signal transduction histidine kinase